MFREVLELEKRVLGPEHPDTLMTIFSIADVLQRQGRYDEASIYYQQACLGFDKVLGSSHPTALNCSRHYRVILNKKNLPTPFP